MGQKTNPFNFKLIDTHIREIPNSPLLQIGLAQSTNQYYAAAVDPITNKRYVLYANISNQGAKFTAEYKDILDEQEHNVVGIFFQKAGVFELYYKGKDWVWHREDGADIVPPWFMNKYNK